MAKGSAKYQDPTDLHRELVFMVGSEPGTLVHIFEALREALQDQVERAPTLRERRLYLKAQRRLAEQIRWARRNNL